MFANARRAALIVLPALGIGAANPAFADDAAPGWNITLTEAAEPDSKAWEDPARISLTIDTRGKDKFSAQVNLEIQRSLTGLFEDRDSALGAYVRWNRESGGSEDQNNFEVGASFDVSPSTRIFDRPAGAGDPTEEANRRSGSISWAFKLSSGYARTAVYPDLGSAPCSITPTLAQCQVQFEESLRSGIQVVPFGVWQEGGSAHGLSYSIEPKFGIDHDLLLNSPIDAVTGLRKTGGYLSAVAALKFKLTPGFISPRWELAASAQLRQALSRSLLRADEIEESAELFKASATYFFALPSDTSPWRVGFGVVYARGSDPLTGKPDASTFVFALRIGQY